MLSTRPRPRCDKREVAKERTGQAGRGGEVDLRGNSLFDSSSYCGGVGFYCLGLVSVLGCPTAVYR